MQLYYHQSSIDCADDGTPCYRKASDQMVVDAAVEILKRKTGKDVFEIELGDENGTD